MLFVVWIVMCTCEFTLCAFNCCWCCFDLLLFTKNSSVARLDTCFLLLHFIGTNPFFGLMESIIQKIIGTPPSTTRKLWTLISIAKRKIFKLAKQTFFWLVYHFVVNDLNPLFVHRITVHSNHFLFIHSLQWTKLWKIE